MKSTIKIKDLFVAAIVLVLIISTANAKTSDPNLKATDYRLVVADINNTMRAYHYNPAELKSADYQKIEAQIVALANNVESDQDFIDGFRAIWKQGPFSHVELNFADTTAEELAEYLDNLRVGGESVNLSWRNKTAVLTVNTMMGLDTIEHIDKAYKEITKNNAERLIIDLRNNGGGAFAIRPLVGHLINNPIDAGSFVSQKWNADHQRPPTNTELSKVSPWQGWSIRTFWNDVQEQQFVKINFKPINPIFNGPVYVLTSKHTASAAELAVDALQSAGRAAVIGEITAGKMLSQKIYDVTGGFHLSLPIADYYSSKNGRIEGVGITPDILVNPDDALNIALAQK